MAERNYELFWNEALNHIRADLGEEEFSRWFKVLSLLKVGEQEITLGVPSGFHRDQLRSRYISRIESALKLIVGHNIAILFEVVQKSAVSSSLQTEYSQVVQMEETLQKGLVSEPIFVQKQAVNLEQGTLFPMPSPVTVVAPSPVKSVQAKKRHIQLRDDYIFERYIIGENNAFAANAAIAISRNPGTTYNPFLIYGGVGLGKTHLMQAIGNSVYRSSDRKIIYITAEDFTNEFIHGTRENKMEAFKNKYRKVDLLLIDDIHFLENKEGTQEELFHTFNALYDAHKQIIFTCDRPASELKKISDRLRSRFERGLNVDLQAPNFETRCAILKSKVKDKNIISNDVLELLAKNISTNIRDLEAALTKLTAYAELLGKPVTLESAQQQLKDVFTSPAKQPSVSSMDTILQVVASYHSISVSDLEGKKQTRKIAEPRQIAMYIAREITDFSYTEIGQLFGGRNHSTVMHAYEKIENQCRSDPVLGVTIQTLIEKITRHPPAG